MKIKNLNFLLPIFLIGCTPEQNTKIIVFNEEALQQAAQKGSIFEKKLSNSTTVSWDRFHGTQIEYHSPSGKSFLWYPGNKQVVSADWKLQKSAFAKYGVKDICYRYQRSSHNPITKKRGGEWECTPSLNNASNKNLQTGDVFKLSQRTNVPYILTKEQQSMQALISRCTDC